MELQSVFFNKENWTVVKANTWLKNNKINPIKADHLNKNLIRYRVQDPKKFKYFYTYKLPNNVGFVYGSSKKVKRSQHGGDEGDDPLKGILSTVSEILPIALAFL